MKISMTQFARDRHLKDGQISNEEDFMQKLNSYLREGKALVKEGAFPFSKILVLDNFVEAKAGTIRIESKNSKYLKSEYTSRREGELPYLSRYFDLPTSYELPKAKFLVVIVYSEEQLTKEEESFEGGGEVKDGYGIVSIQFNMDPDAEPMTPMTIYRNALGTSYGGNGVQIDKSQLLKSAEFWNKNALVK